MKYSHLEELVRHITRTILKEYYSSMTTSVGKKMGDVDSIKQDPSIPPIDAMSDEEKRKAARDVRLAAKVKMDAAKLQKDADDKTMAGFRSQVRNYDQIGKRNNQKEVDRTKRAFRDSGMKSSEI